MNIDSMKESLSNQYEALAYELQLLKVGAKEALTPLGATAFNALVNSSEVMGRFGDFAARHKFLIPLVNVVLVLGTGLAACGPEGTAVPPSNPTENAPAPTESVLMPDGAPTQVVQEQEVRSDAGIAFFDEKYFALERVKFEGGKATSYDSNGKLVEYAKGSEIEGLTVLGGFNVSVDNSADQRSFLYGTRSGGGETFLVLGEDGVWHEMDGTTYPGYEQFFDYGLWEGESSGRMPANQFEATERTVFNPMFGSETDEEGAVTEFWYFDQTGAGHKLKKEFFGAKMAVPGFASESYIKAAVMMENSEYKDTWNFEWAEDGTLQLRAGEGTYVWDGSDWIEPMAAINEAQWKAMSPAEKAKYIEATAPKELADGATWSTERAGTVLFYRDSEGRLVTGYDVVQGREIPLQETYQAILDAAGIDKKNGWGWGETAGGGSIGRDMAVTPINPGLEESVTLANGYTYKGFWAVLADMQTGEARPAFVAIFIYDQNGNGLGDTTKWDNGVDVYGDMTEFGKVYKVHYVDEVVEGRSDSPVGYPYWDLYDRAGGQNPFALMRKGGAEYLKFEWPDNITVMANNVKEGFPKTRGDFPPQP